MRVELAGLAIEVAPADHLSHSENEALLRWGADSARGSANTRPFRLDLVPFDDMPVTAAASHIDGPAQISSRADGVIIRHARFVAELDPIARRGRLARDPGTSAALEITLRTALCCLLPFFGGITLHAAGIDFDDRGVVFFGPSGAGKTTIASSCPHPVYSDELVAVTGPSWQLHRTGVWGELGSGANVAHHPSRLTFLAELDRGAGLELEPLDHQHALRRLLGVVVLPPSIVLWTEATRVLRDLVVSIPVYRMRWNPAEPPWTGLTNLLTFDVGRSPASTVSASRSHP